jgi:hypothetical protein
MGKPSPWHRAGRFEVLKTSQANIPAPVKARFAERFSLV